MALSYFMCNKGYVNERNTPMTKSLTSPGCSFSAKSYWAQALPLMGKFQNKCRNGNLGSAMRPGTDSWWEARDRGRAGLSWWCFGADSPVLLVLWNTIISPKLKMHMGDVMGSLVIGKPAFGPRLYCWPLRDINTSPLLPQFSFPPLKNTWVRLAEESPSSVSFIFHSFLFLCKCYRLSFSSM